MKDPFLTSSADPSPDDPVGEAVRRASLERDPRIYVTRDSGKRQDYPSGMRRDTDEGKPRFDLIDLDMLTRWAELMARGAEKYGQDNWKLANSKEELTRFRASAFSHFVRWLRGVQDGEDHAAAVLFNIAAAEYVKGRLG